MKSFDFNISQISSGIKTLDKGRYEVIVLSEPKAYFTKGKDHPVTGEPGQDRFGVRMTFRVAEGDEKDQNLIYSPNFGGEYPESGLAKQALMAVHGFTTQTESEFNAQFADKNYSLDFNDVNAPIIGDGWKEMKGKRLIVNLDVNFAKDGSGKQFQKFVSFDVA
jgi:hypothetical protein